MRPFRTATTAAALALLTLGCAPDADVDEDMQAPGSDAAVDVAAEEQAIRQRIDAYEAAANEDTSEAFAGFFLDDGVLLMPNAPAATGPGAVAEAMTPMFQVAESVSFETQAVEVAGSGDLAVEYGTYDLTGTLPDGAAMADNGKYIVVWRKEGGEWMVAYDIFNSDQPAQQGS